jgi:hypothetical protein
MKTNLLRIIVRASKATQILSVVGLLALSFFFLKPTTAKAQLPDQQCISASYSCAVLCNGQEGCQEDWIVLSNMQNFIWEKIS